MTSRNRQLPVLARKRMVIPACRYNRVRVALNRLENPIRLGLTGIRDWDMILDDDTWVCVDTRLNGRPVIALSDFEAAGRSALHLPIACRADIYAIHAETHLYLALESMDRLLAARLARQAFNKGVRSGEVSRLKLGKS